MNQKKLITILATITIIAILSVSLFFTQFSAATATTYNANNITVNGVLASDSYVLFPYDKENLIFGFSKYGELINGEAKVGLKYDGLDVFANPNVLEKDWSQGWFIDIHYVDLENNYKRAWAFAMYSDLSGSTGIGGDWKEGCTGEPTGTPYGGRKTNVWATTDPIKVLYDGPRRFVALTKTTLYDASTKTADDVLVSITITFVFDKDKKVVTLFKDIKRLATGKFGRTFQVEFSNRGEWDIGTSAAPPSYAHFYDNLATVYDYEYHDFYSATNDITGFDMCQMIDQDGSYVGFAAFWPQLFGKLVDGTTHITRSTILKSLCTVEKNYTWSVLDLGDHYIDFDKLGWPSSDPYPIGLGAISDAPMVFKNRVLLTGGVDYTWDSADDNIKFMVEPLDTDYITIVYKHEVNPRADDMISHAGIEPDTPYVIGEWCFELRNEDYKRQFRAVTVYGLTDRHDADDDDSTETWTGGANVIDSEVQYYLDETFKPYDLYSAVDKDTRRWVDFHTITAAEVTAKRVSFNLTHVPVVKPDDWLAYCNWAEKVEWGGALRTPYRARSIFGGYNYTFYRTADGVGNITITGLNVPVAGTVIKVLYSTRPEWDSIGSVFLSSKKVGGIVSPGNGLTFDYTGSYLFAPDPLGVIHGFDFTVTMNVTVDQDENFTETASVSLDGVHWDFKVLKEQTFYNSYWFWDDVVRKGTNITLTSLTRNPTNVYWNITSTEEAVHMDMLDIRLFLQATAEYNTTNDMLNVTLAPEMWYHYSEHFMGTYEWIVVGKDAATIDSLGAAYMTEAFDSVKQIHVKMAGMDINETAAHGAYAPFVMAGAATDTKDDYRDTLGRTFLRDDWCTTYPVSSGNMLFSGGPGANLGAEYFNEFTNAFWARTEYVVNDTGQAFKIFALSCWSRNSYGSGYAVISVYQDLNGTIGFLIWGTTGQDTYYATKWFWEKGIVYLQTENRGVTDIVLKIKYPTDDPTHPTVSIKERLGTISEKTPHDP
jgi:hypothetical protein